MQKIYSSNNGEGIHCFYQIRGKDDLKNSYTTLKIFNRYAKRKAHFLLVLFIAFTSIKTAFGQDSLKTNETFKHVIGVRCGLNVSKFSNSSITKPFRIKSDYTVGYQMGFDYQFLIYKKQNIWLSNELYFLQAGGGYKINITDQWGNVLYPQAKVASRLFYLRYSPIIKKSIMNNNIMVMAGPYIGLLTHASNNIEATKTTTRITSQMKRWDMGITGGLGYCINLKGNIRMVPELRTNWGYSSISNSSVNPFMGSKNIGYNFNISVEKKF